MRRLVLVASAVLAAGFAVPALANPLPPNPVHVDRQPDGSVCVSVSLQVPHCTPPTG